MRLREAHGPIPSPPRSVVVAALATALLGTPSVSVGEALVPVELQAEILARVLAYDRALPTRLEETVTIGLLFREGDQSSVNLKAIQVFGALAGRELSGLTLAVTQRAFRDPGDLAGWVAEAGVDLVYVSPGLEHEVSAIASRCRELGIMSASPLRASVERGLTFGVVAKKNKPGVLVNLPVAEEVGMDLDPELLDLATILR